MTSDASAPHILVVGGGYVGMSTALRLQRRLRRGEATITVVAAQPNMTYQPFLAEAASGLVEARQVVVPLRRVLRRCRVLDGEVSTVDHPRRVATVALAGGEQLSLHYDVLVLASGSVSRTLPVPGLAECGVGFRTVGEAIYLRNQVLSQLDEASSTEDPQRRQRALTFVFVGGGYAGIEALGELEDMARHALRFHPSLSPSATRWVLVEAADRILPELSRSLAEYTVRRLCERGVEVRLETQVESMVDGHVVLSGGERFDAGTVVWTAGGKAHPLAARSGLPVDLTGRVVCTPYLQVANTQGAWSAGDCAAVPDLSKRDVPGAVCGPTAQHAVRQAKRLADNLVAVLRGRQPKPYRHADVGSVASLGLHKGVAEVYGVKLRGRPAWYLHRVYHLSRVPTLEHKVRVLAGWTLALLLRRELVSLGQLQHPRREWESAVRQAEPASR